MINEMIPDWLYDLMKKGEPITDEKYQNLNSKKYTSGRNIEVGDYVLVGMLAETIPPKDQDSIPEINIKIIFFHPDEIGSLYERNEMYNNLSPSSKIPYLKYLDKKDKM